MDLLSLFQQSKNFFIFLQKSIASFVAICYNLKVVIPLVTSNKISIPNTPFERFFYILYGWENPLLKKRGFSFFVFIILFLNL